MGIDVLKNKKRFAIAIDGPSGSGKSTAAKRAANAFGFIYVDTGAMYRAVALYCMEKNRDLSDKAAVIPLLGEIEIELKFIGGRQCIFLNGYDVTDEIRTQPVADGSSKVAAIYEVRQKLVAIQRKIAESNDIIMDGRDIGTHVLPGAQLKIYLDAAAEVRAKRRVGELKDKGIAADYDQVLKEITERDERDMTRESSPLKMADDAVRIDTGDMDIDEVAQKIIGIYGERVRF